MGSTPNGHQLAPCCQRQTTASTHRPRTRPVLVEVVAGEVARDDLDGVALPCEDDGGGEADDCDEQLALCSDPPPAPATTIDGGVGPKVAMVGG